MSHTTGDWGIRFAVDDVKAISSELKQTRASEALEGLVGRPMVACWEPGRMLVSGGSEIENGLIAAIHHAFSEHRPLVLSPDAVWLTIAQGVAQHINRHAEELRGDLVGHRGTRALRVAIPSGANADMDWQPVIESFAALIGERHADLSSLLTCDFSTSGPAERIASHVVLMNALKRYYDFIGVSICGIPSITLEGTADDWKEIARRAGELSRYGLEFWTKHLVGVCEQFVRARDGDIDLEHWRAIYKKRTGYGTTYVNGWITHLFPYVGPDDALRKNPALAEPPQSYLRVPVGDDHISFLGVDPQEPFSSTWLTSGSFPNGLRSAPIHLQGPAGTGEIFDVLAGVVGYEEADGLRPVIGWGVSSPTAIAALLNELGSCIEPRESKALVSRVTCFSETPADMNEFWDAHDGATLKVKSSRVLELLSRDEFGGLVLLDEPPAGDIVLRGAATVFARAGEHLLAVLFREGEWTILAWSRGKDASNVHVVARSFTHYLQQVAENGDALFFLQDSYEPRETLRYGFIEEEPPDDPDIDPVTGLFVGRGNHWDGVATAWRIEESMEPWSVFSVACGEAMTPTATELLRDFDDGLRALGARDAHEQLKRLEVLVIGPVSEARGSEIAARFDEAGLHYTIARERHKATRVIHRESGKILDLAWDIDERTLTQMRAYGVEVVVIGAD